MTSQPAAEVVLAAISAEPLSVDAVLAAVRDPRAGAAVVAYGPGTAAVSTDRRAFGLSP